MDQLCIKCGKRKAVIGLLCLECYEPNIKIKPIEIEQCKYCHRIKLYGKYVNYNKEAIERYVESKIKGDVLKAKFVLQEGVAYITLKSHPNVEIKKHIDIKIKPSVCNDCSRAIGGYYEAIIQLRGNKQKIKKIQKILTNLLKKDTFISKIKELKEGIDLYAGSSKAAFNIIKNLGLKHKISRKLAGVKEGKRFYRITIAIKLD